MRAIVRQNEMEYLFSNRVSSSKTPQRSVGVFLEKGKLKENV